MKPESEKSVHGWFFKIRCNVFFFLFVFWVEEGGGWVTIKRIIVFWGIDCGSPTLGNYHMEVCF